MKWQIHNSEITFVMFHFVSSTFRGHEMIRKMKKVTQLKSTPYQKQSQQFLILSRKKKFDTEVKS